MPQAVRTYLEMKEPRELDAAPLPSGGVALEQVGQPDAALWRFLYTEVGRPYHWVDRRAWTDDEARRYLADPAVELWVLRVEQEVAGYFELRSDDEGGVEIAYLGLLPAFVGRGLGKGLLTCAVRRAWERTAVRVWLHTSSRDHTAALPNYLARGFRVWKQEVYDA